MTITREQVADLQPGDVVRVSDESEGWTIEGPVWLDRVDSVRSTVRCGPVLLRSFDGSPSADRDRVMAVVSRAPRPLYVNHPRTEPVPGDVVRDADGDDPTVWACHENPRDYGLPWLRLVSIGDEVDLDEMPTRLRLLVDGSTGEVVQ